MMNPRVQSPVLAGLGRTYLYLPDIPYTEQELELIFKHELFHYRHKDLWYKMLLLIVVRVLLVQPAASLDDRGSGQRYRIHL